MCSINPEVFPRELICTSWRNSTLKDMCYYLSRGELKYGMKGMKEKKEEGKTGVRHFVIQSSELPFFQKIIELLLQLQVLVLMKLLFLVLTDTIKLPFKEVSTIDGIGECFFPPHHGQFNTWPNFLPS